MRPLTWPFSIAKIRRLHNMSSVIHEMACMIYISFLFPARLSKVFFSNSCYNLLRYVTLVVTSMEAYSLCSLLSWIYWPRNLLREFHGSIVVGDVTHVLMIIYLFSFIQCLIFLTSNNNNNIIIIFISSIIIINNLLLDLLFNKSTRYMIFNVYYSILIQYLFTSVKKFHISHLSTLT